VCKEVLHTKGNCLPKIQNNDKYFTPCGQAVKLIADIVSLLLQLLLLVCADGQWAGGGCSEGGSAVRLERLTTATPNIRAPFPADGL
jgi:hypothetical protein